jgi:hypothetical protein
MQTVDPTGQDWSDHEIDLIVADYFRMLEMELSGRSYVKAQHNAALQELTGRSRGSIEFKHQNISAVLMELGMPWIPGYKPMANYQAKLITGIERFIPKGISLLGVADTKSDKLLQEDSILYFEAPPAKASERAPLPSILARLIRKFDPAARDAQNRTIGKLGEERVLHSERIRLTQRGRDDLAKRVRWISDEEGDGAGYDILSFNLSGSERFVEVETTPGHQTTPFYLSENERSLSVEEPERFRIMRVYQCLQIPKAFVMKPPLEETIWLSPTQFRATF